MISGHEDDELAQGDLNKGELLRLKAETEPLVKKIPKGLHTRESRHPARFVLSARSQKFIPPRSAAACDFQVMELETLYDLYVHELKDLYSAEQQLIKALPKMSKAATNRQLVAGFNQHLQQTKQHAKRLEQIFERLDESSRGPKCEGMEGLIAEGDKMAKEDAEDEVRDAGLIAAAQRVEHYEIAGYGCARTYAELLGDKTGARLLDATLKEEGETDKKLTKLAKSAINLNAIYVPRAGKKSESSLTQKAKNLLARLTS
jgi:ferritin-like metal-binding protein YciE